MHVPPPCGKVCPKRSATCHATCKDFIKWDKRRRKLKSEINKEKEMSWRNFNGR